MIPMKCGLAIALVGLACGLLPGARAQVPAQPIMTAIPLGLPPLPASAEAATPSIVALGKRLFYATTLAQDYTVACSTCHDPRFGFADRQRLSPGVAGGRGTCNSPTIAN